jgi:hypothetical protein
MSKTWVSLLFISLGIFPLAFIPKSTPSLPAGYTAEVIYLPLVSSGIPPFVADIRFEFDQVVTPSDDNRALAVAFSAISFIDSRGDTIAELDFGTAEANELQTAGWYENQVWPEEDWQSDIGTYQWAGGEQQAATMQLPVPANTTALLLHVTAIVDELWMDVVIDEQSVATRRVDAYWPWGSQYWHSIYVPLVKHNPQPTPTDKPSWTSGRYFPAFPPAQRIYAIRVRHDYYGWSEPESPDFRVNDSYHTMMALTLVGMQGVINRGGPAVYLEWFPSAGGDSNKFWIPLIEDYTDVVYLELDGLSAVNFLLERFGTRFSGAVIYDPEVPDTINLATMIAGLEDRLILAPDQLDLPGIPQYKSVNDLRDLVISEGWDGTIESQTAIYQWVYDNLWPNLDQRIIGVISPGPPTSRYFPDSNDRMLALGYGARDYIVSLRLAALWLSPLEEPQASLFEKFLSEAPSPIPVMGFFGNDEYGTVALASSYGDWVPVITNSHGGPENGSNLSVFAGIRPEIIPYNHEIDPDSIFATLDDKPIMTIVSSDGDSIQILMNRGIYGQANFVWEEVQGQHFGWSTNPVLSELAPLVWNYYEQTRQEVGLHSFFSGAGYAYPLMMDQAELRAYLEYTARYFEDTGLRTLTPSLTLSDTENGLWDQLAIQYHQVLSDTGYLGGIALRKWPYEFNLEYAGTPSPMVYMNYIYNDYSEEDEIIADILAKAGGKMVFDPSASYTLGQVISDTAAVDGEAVLFARDSLPGCCVVLESPGGGLDLAPGTYTVTYSLKVPENSDDGTLAQLYVIDPTEGYDLIAQQYLAPSDFNQAGVYQDFTINFTLDQVTADVNILMDFYGDLGVDCGLEQCAELDHMYLDEYKYTITDGPDIPLIAPIMIVIIDQSRELTYSPGLTKKFEDAGGIALYPHELLAALNPEYMIEWATPILGEQHAAILRAQDQLDNKLFLESLLTIRSALRELPSQAYNLTLQKDGQSFDLQIQANTWITDLDFDPASDQITFRTHGPASGTAEIKMITPVELVSENWYITLDGESQPLITTSLPSPNLISFSMPQGPHAVSVTLGE